MVVVNGVDRDMLEAPADTQSPYESESGDRHAMTTLPGAVTPSNDRARRFLEAVDEELNGHSPRVTLHVLGADAHPPARGSVFMGTSRR